MTPVNNKSLLALLNTQLEKLDNNEIDNEKAKAFSGLFHQANAIMNYELKRAKTKIDIEKHNKEFNSNIELREVESKNFE